MMFHGRDKPEQAILELGDLALGFGLKTMLLLNLKGKSATW